MSGPFAVIELDAGTVHGLLDSKAEAAASRLFAKLSFHEVAIVSYAPMTGTVRGWSRPVPVGDPRDMLDVAKGEWPASARWTGGSGSIRTGRDRAISGGTRAWPHSHPVPRIAARGLLRSVFRPQPRPSGLDRSTPTPRRHLDGYRHYQTLITFRRNRRDPRRPLDFQPQSASSSELSRRVLCTS